MGNYFSKQPGSRISTSNITLSGNAASTPSTTFSNQTYQVRVNPADLHRRWCANGGWQY